MQNFATGATLFGPATPPEFLSKSNFAEHLGITPARVTQMIAMGLPVERSGWINIKAGEDWYRANIDANRRHGLTDGPAPGNPHKAALDASNARIAELKAMKMAGEVLDRRTTLAAIESRARSDRDAWLGWIGRTAPELARATGGDLHTVMNLLDRLVRDQLDTLSKHAITGLENDR